MINYKVYYATFSQLQYNMAERYPKRKLSSEDISRALNFDSDSEDSNDKHEKLLGKDSVSDIEFTLTRPRKSYISDSDSDSV